MASSVLSEEGRGPWEESRQIGSHQTIIQIYVDWANHYLQKGRSTRRIQELQTDVRDGVIVADIVYAITNQKVPGVTRKPKNSSQMLENLETVLNFVADLGVQLDGISSEVIREGQLRPILRLFFELSRYKQKDMQSSQSQPKREKFLAGGGGKTNSSIPVPGNQSAFSKKSSHNHMLYPGNASGNSSRSTSPSSHTHPHHSSSSLSLIPMPRPVSQQPPPRTTTLLSEKDRVNSSKSSMSSKEKNSMLQKLKTFKDRETTPTVNNSSKRSSSSGFSSAKSDSSISNNAKTESQPQLQMLESVKNQSEPVLKRYGDKGNGVGLSAESLPTNGNSASFLRNPRTLTGNKDSRLRYSATGIPTRPTSNNINNNQTQNMQPMTLIPQPKPTAAVKGHTKSGTFNPVDKSFLVQKKRLRPESMETSGKKELKAIVAPMPPSSQQVSPQVEDKVELEEKAIVATKIQERSIKSSEQKESEELDDEDEVLKDVQPMEPLQRKSTYGPLRSPPFISPPILSSQSDPLTDISPRDLLFGSFLMEAGNRLQKTKEESFEESSSLSSGVSDLNEVPTDSGTSDLSSPYASIRRLEKEERSRSSAVKDFAGLDGGPSTCADNAGMTGVREEFSDGQNCRNDEWNRRPKLSFGYSRTTTTHNGLSASKSSTQQQSIVLHGNSRQDEARVAQHVSLSQRPPPHLLPSNKGRTRTRVKVSGGTQTTNDLNSHEYSTSQTSKSLSLTSPTAAQLSESLRQRILLGSQSLPKGASADYAAILNTIQLQQTQFHQNRFQHQQQEDFRRAKERRLARESSYAIYSELKDAYTNSSTNRQSSPYAASLHSQSSRVNTGGSLTDGESLESLTSTTSSAATNRREPRARSRGSAQTPNLNRDTSPLNLNRSNSISHFCERTFPRSTRSEKIYPSMLHRTEDNAHLFAIRTTQVEPVNSQHRLSSSAYNGNTQKNNQPLRLSMSPYAIFGRPKDDDIDGSSLSLISTASSMYSTQEEKQAHELRKLRRELQENHEKIHTLNSQLSTNAHVVAAFEQSLANMTHRLQNLTMSAEQKDSELLELRRTIEVIKKQSMEAGLILPLLSTAASRDCSPIGRQLSADSVSSINSISSATSAHSQTSTPQHQHPPVNNRPRGKGWLRSSFSKAFSRSKGGKTKDGDQQQNEREAQCCDNPSKRDQTSTSLPSNEEKEKSAEELRKQLREKEMVLTDIRLEALTSAHQLESLKDTLAKMRSEMVSLRQENERLQRMVSTKSGATRIDLANGESSIDIELASPIGEKEGKLVLVVVSSNAQSENISEVPIGKLCVSTRTKWDLLDSLVRRVFKEYVCRIDPVGGLGLSQESILSYSVGDVTRSRDSSRTPELLPCGYLVGEVNRIRISLKGAATGGAVDSLSFHTLIHKQSLLRWVGCLTESSRLLLSGIRGVGKSYLAQRLAMWLVMREGKEPSPEAIPTISAEGRNGYELEEYLVTWAEQWNGDCPSVLIIENIHDSIPEPFTNSRSKPYLIATTTQSPSGTRLLHSFRCVELSPLQDPLRGLVGRSLERRLVELECSGTEGEVGKIYRWIPQVYTEINDWLERNNQTPIGPRLFLPCPSESGSAETWFTNLWNNTLQTYLRDAKSQSQGEGEDPLQFIIRTFPWPSQNTFS